jgi:chromosome segregation ATPase
MRSDNRIVRLEVEQLVSRRRQLDAEQSTLQERSRTENARLEAEEAEWRRRGTTAERQLADAEKRFKEAKDKLATTEAEQILLSQSVEELRRQQVFPHAVAIFLSHSKNGKHIST